MRSIQEISNGLSVILVCYSCRDGTVNQPGELPIAAFSNHLLGFRRLYAFLINPNHR